MCGLSDTPLPNLIKTSKTEDAKTRSVLPLKDKSTEMAFGGGSKLTYGS